MAVNTLTKHSLDPERPGGWLTRKLIIGATASAQQDQFFELPKNVKILDYNIIVTRLAVVATSWTLTPKLKNTGGDVTFGAAHAAHGGNVGKGFVWDRATGLAGGGTLASALISNADKTKIVLESTITGAITTAPIVIWSVLVQRVDMNPDASLV